jgi:hypothetical protein
MTSRNWTLVFISLGMMSHAIALGPYLGPSFFLTSMCWGWVACCGLLGRLEAARSMAVVMFGLVSVAVVLVFFSAEREARLAILTLGLLPSVVSWGCLAYFVSFLIRQELDRGSGEPGASRAHSYGGFERVMLTAPGVSEQGASGLQVQGSRGAGLLRRRLRDAA